jgi:glucose uptake protein GlcU
MYVEFVLFAFQTIIAAQRTGEIFLFMPFIRFALAFILVGIFGGVYFLRQKKTTEAISLVNTVLLAIIILFNIN